MIEASLAPILCMQTDLTVQYLMLKVFVGFGVITIFLYITSCLIYATYPFVSDALSLGLSIAAPHVVSIDPHTDLIMLYLFPFIQS